MTGEHLQVAAKESATLNRTWLPNVVELFGGGGDDYDGEGWACTQCGSYQGAHAEVLDREQRCEAISANRRRSTC